MPAFSSSMLKRSFDVIVAISEKALDHWSTLPQIDVRTEMTKAPDPPHPPLPQSRFRFVLAL
jgi:hypothetical protein